ncbi:response regulator, partial [Eubacteriales bacterium DFI.9.88]|nr:response regulator [Eubacteriales bacterium DFI.9.88]
MYNILICDDEKDIVSAIKIYLASNDYHLYEAYDGREALEVIEQEEIHLILLDIMMPKLDGVQVL